jgi:hypothetical protein
MEARIVYYDDIGWNDKPNSTNYPPPHDHHRLLVNEITTGWQKGTPLSVLKNRKVSQRLFNPFVSYIASQRLTGCAPHIDNPLGDRLAPSGHI